MSTLADIPTYRMLSDGVASGNPFSYFAVECVRPGIFIYTPTPAIAAGFVNEEDANTFAKAAANSARSYEIYCSRKHYEFHAPLLPEFSKKWKDKLL